MSEKMSKEKIQSKDFTPLKDWVLIKKDFIGEKSKGGVILITKQEERPVKGTILKIGPDVKHVKTGDKVVFHYAAGTTFEDSFEEKLSLINEKDIYGILE